MYPRWTGFSILLLMSALVASADNGVIPSSLRGGIDCDQTVIAKAVELTAQGWIYKMPKPRSTEASWANYDTKTTWWIGYWDNTKTGDKSINVPIKDPTDKYVGDGNGGSKWAGGGPPPAPSKLQWLCSKSGGIKPR